MGRDSATTQRTRGRAMKRCAWCHGRLGLGVRSRNLWNGSWWVHVRFCSTHCEALAIVYGKALQRRGSIIATAQIYRRVWQLYVAHIFLFVLARNEDEHLGG